MQDSITFHNDLDCRLVKRGWESNQENLGVNFGALRREEITAGTPNPSEMRIHRIVAGDPLVLSKVEERASKGRGMETIVSHAERLSGCAGNQAK